VAHLLGQEEAFCLTYGDGVSDIDVSSEVAFHRRHGRWATVAGVQPPSRYGALEIKDDDQVVGFAEKPAGEVGYINGGFFVLSPKVLSLIEGDSTSWEGDVMPIIATSDQLMCYAHTGFWQPMDTLRERNALEAQWADGSAPWKIW